MVMASVLSASSVLSVESSFFGVAQTTTVIVATFYAPE